MFGDLLTKLAQAVLAGILVLNFFSSLVYLTILFLYGKQLHSYKTATPKSYRNSLDSTGTNNWPHAAYMKQVNIPNLNFLQNHPPITRTNSVSISTNTDGLMSGMMSELAICTLHHHHHTLHSHTMSPLPSPPSLTMITSSSSTSTSSSGDDDDNNTPNLSPRSDVD
jgi:hypothetical protein